MIAPISRLWHQRVKQSYNITHIWSCFPLPKDWSDKLTWPFRSRNPSNCARCRSRSSRGVSGRAWAFLVATSSLWGFNQKFQFSHFSLMSAPQKFNQKLISTRNCLAFKIEIIKNLFIRPSEVRSHQARLWDVYQNLYWSVFNIITSGGEIQKFNFWLNFWLIFS